jgi:hypothetical protein
MPDENKPTQPTQPSAEQIVQGPPEKPAQPKNILFKGGQVPKEQDLGKIDRRSKES